MTLHLGKGVLHERALGPIFLLLSLLKVVMIKTIETVTAVKKTAQLITAARVEK